MSELRLLNCVENGAGICRNELLFEAMQESFNGLKEKNRVLAEELDNLRASKGIDEIIARAEAAEVRVAELEAALKIVLQISEDHAIFRAHASELMQVYDALKGGEKNEIRY